jgi:hypothetical protein
MSPILECRSPANASHSRAERWLSAACSISHGALQFGLALVVCGPMSAGAQDSLAKSDSTVRPQGGWIIGPSIGVFTAGGEVSPELITVGLQFTSLTPARLGADISIGTMPRALADGILAVGIRADAAYPVSVLPHLLLLPAAGLSVVGVGGDGGGGGAMGINAGLAAVFHGNSPTGLRLGVTVHKFAMLETPVFLVELGVVRVSGLEPR